MSEAFVYLWYDSENKMFYLGKHKGTPEDRYTHSSTIWESFTKDNIPKGTKRRILVYGTDKEMCELEHNMLKNRKSRCWDRYYNESLGDPRYVDTSGENNPMYKHGFFTGKHASNPEIVAQFKQNIKQYNKQYNKDNKENKAKYNKQYNKDNKEKRAAYDKQYYIDNKEKMAEYYKDNKEKRAEYNKDNKENKAAYDKQYREKRRMKQRYKETC